MVPRVEGTEVLVPAWASNESKGVVLQVFRHWQMKRRRLSNPIAHIKLNQSGRIIRIPLDDCEVTHGRL